MTAGILSAMSGFQRSRYYATFDGTNDYLSKSGGLDNAIDGTGFSCVFWLDKTFGASSDSVLSIGGKIEINTSGKTLEVRAYNSAGTNILQFTKGSYFLDGAHCYFISWQQGGNFRAYTDDSNNSTTPTPNLTQDIDISNTGTIQIMDGAYNRMSGDIYNFWADDQYIDFGIEANRRKFLTAAGKAENLGATGYIPTGSQPLIYLNGYGNFINRGCGGVFTENGAITQGGAAPL